MPMIKKSITLSFTLFLLLYAITLMAAIPENNAYEFDIRKDPYEFATYFQIDSQNTYIGTVKKNYFRIRTNYDLSNESGWQATGIKRVFNLGFFYAWGSKVDIYDTQGIKIAMIDGQINTTEKAKFNLYHYNEDGNYPCVGIAYLDHDYNNFTIFYPDGGPDPIGILTRYQFSIDGETDFWKVKIYHPEQIDDRLVRIFAAFVIDHQEYFHKPPVINEDDYEDEIYE